MPCRCAARPPSPALELAQHARRASNPYSDAHVRHFMDNAEAFVAQHAARLAAAFGDMTLSSFTPRDWVAQVEAGVAVEATVLTATPLLRSGREAHARWLEEHVEWDRPVTGKTDPATIEATIQRLAASGSGYAVVSDQQIAGLEERGRYQPPGGATWRVYASAGPSRLARFKSTGKAFAYNRLDPAKITADSQVKVIRAAGDEALYARIVYVKNTIAPAPALQNYFVLVDEMLAGILSFALNESADQAHGVACYLMSDICTTRERRLSKLVSRLAINRDVVGDFGARMMWPFDYVITTAFSDHQVSMKYRGLFDLLWRREAEGDAQGWLLQYGSKLLAETPQQAFDWWWSNHGDPKAKETGAGARGRGGRRPAPGR